MLRLAQQKEREGAGIPGGLSSPAKGWVVTNGAAAPPVGAAREGRAREERVREKGKGFKKDEPEAGGPEPCQRARARLPPHYLKLGAEPQGWYFRLSNLLRVEFKKSQALIRTPSQIISSKL